MKISEHVIYAIDDAKADKFDAAMLHACIAIDGTARRLYPAMKQGKARYKKSLRAYYWLLEPMLGGGIHLVETRFSNVQLEKNLLPDLADIIYEIFRCNHAHADEVPVPFSVMPSSGAFLSRWILADNELRMPDRVLWGLLAVTVFSRANAAEKTTGDYYLSLGEEKFRIADWWGREDEFRPVADKYNQTRVTIDW